MSDSQYSIIDLMELSVSDRAGTLRCRTGEPPSLVADGEERGVAGPELALENAVHMLTVLAGPRRMRDLWKNGAIEFEYEFRRQARFKVRATQTGEDIEFDLNLMA